MKRTLKQLENGYTIIETMIAISLFIIVVVTGLGSFLNANVVHHKSEDMRSILDNLSYVMEDMSRNLRTGYVYHCIYGVSGSGTAATSPSSFLSTPASCPSGGWGIAFETDVGDNTTRDGDPIDYDDQWVYYIGVDTSIPGNRVGVWKAVAGPYGASAFTKVTPDEVNIDAAASSITVIGAESYSSGNRQQPYVIIRLVGTITYKNVVTPFSLQTAVSERLIDV